VRPDDPSIPDSEGLWRRILPLKGWIKIEGDQPRPSSMAFIDRRSGEVSVHRSSLTTQGAVLEGRDRESLAELLARVPRSLGCSVAPDPIRDPEDPDRISDPSHALICPPPTSTKADARKMAEACTWVVLRQETVDSCCS